MNGLFDFLSSAGETDFFARWFGYLGSYDRCPEDLDSTDRYCGEIDFLVASDFFGGDTDFFT